MHHCNSKCYCGKKDSTFHIAWFQSKYPLAVSHGTVPVLEVDLCLGSVVACSHSWYNGEAPLMEGQKQIRPLFMRLMDKHLEEH